MLETVDDLKSRTGEATKRIDLCRLGVSAQGGFVFTAAGNPLTEVDDRAKLRLLVAASRTIWV